MFGDDTRYKIDERLHRLNELGFDVEELELVAGDDGGYRLRLNPRVVEPGHHRRRLHALTGLMAQENQARRLLNDLARYRAELDRAGKRPVPETVAVHRWLSEVFEPAVAAIPAELWGKRDAAEVFHEALEHRWFLSQQAGEDVGLMPAVEAYVEDVLRHAPDERAVLEPGADGGGRTERLSADSTKSARSRSIVTGVSGASRPSLGTIEILSATSWPLVTFPKTVCLPSSHGAASVVTMKNWLPFVFGPEFAIASAPRSTLWSLNSSSNW